MSILVMGDEQNYHAAVSKAVKTHGKLSHHAETAQVAGNYFDLIKPELVVLCYDTVEKSEVGLKALYAHSESAAHSDFTTLLLCSKNETLTALSLCLDHIFDDYLIAKPLQDSAQLEWRIHSLLSEYRANAKSLIDELASHFALIQKKLNEGGNAVNNPNAPANKSARQS